MNKVFFNDLNLPNPSYNLHKGFRPHLNKITEMLKKIEKILINESPNIVLVQGDTNSALSGALIASELGIKVVHIEAGLRSYDETMPEEINRIVIDHLSDYLFCL